MLTTSHPNINNLRASLLKQSHKHSRIYFESKLTTTSAKSYAGRKTASMKKADVMDELKHKILEADQSWLEVTFIPEKGRGVLAKRKYNAGDYVREYDGELITYNEGRQRESEYDQSMVCYQYFFE